MWGFFLWKFFFPHLTEFDCTASTVLYPRTHGLLGSTKLAHFPTFLHTFFLACSPCSCLFLSEEKKKHYPTNKALLISLQVSCDAVQKYVHDVPTELPFFLHIPPLVVGLHPTSFFFFFSFSHVRKSTQDALWHPFRSQPIRALPATCFWKQDWPVLL